MLKPNMEKRLNQHINEELHASYLYLSMSAYCRSHGMDGFARWLKVQSEEERAHAMRIYEYINEQGGHVLLKALPEPQTDFSSYTALFKDVLAHEQKVTAQINDLMALAMEIKDYATQVFLQWFVTEQVEEEDAAGEVLHKVQMVQEHPIGLLALDRELGARSSGN